MIANIREARRDELPQIVTLYNLMWSDSENPIDIKTAQSVFDGMSKGGRWMFVAEVDDRVVGSFMIVKSGEGRECVLDNVVVHPRYQRQGIGRQIVDFVADRCRREGCRQIVGSIRERHESSRAFWQSMGFERQLNRYVKTVD